MYQHMDQSERAERKAALRERYLNFEIDTKRLIHELRSLRYTADEVSEATKEAFDARSALVTSRGSPVGVSSPMGRQFPTKADREAYEASVAWLADYRKRNRVPD